MTSHARPRSLLLLGGGALCIIASAIGIWTTKESVEERTVPAELPQQKEPAVTAPERPEPLRSRLAIVSEGSREVSGQQAPSPFDPAAIHKLLSRIELDTNGLPVLDDRALATLRTGFATLRTELSDTRLQDLQATVASALPGVAGEQAAKLVGDYYRYDVALRNLEASTDPPETSAAAQVHYEQLIALRQQHFDSETTAKLFGREQELARFTIESMRIQEQSALSQADKDRLQASLREQLPQGVLPDKPSIADLQWRQRFAQFARERQLILEAGLAERDQQEQIERLLATHFRPHELERARRSVAVEE